jgi:membrane protein
VKTANTSMGIKEHSGSFRVDHIPSLLVETYKAWDKSNPFRLSAVVAYYAVLSLPALLVIIVNVIGAIWGQEIVEGRLTSEFSSALGKDAADAIQNMLADTQNEDKNLISTIIGIGTLLFGATGMFYQLQISLNQIWNVERDPYAKWWKVVLDRARSFAFILVIGFLLLVSFVLTAAISALRDFIKESFPDVLVFVAYLLDVFVSLGIITVLFTLMFIFLPDAKIRWKTAWLGAFITAVLFVIGKFLMGYYFGQANPGSTYGAAGTIVLILLWVSYSCLILFFGAQFTYVYAKRYGSGIQPMSIARKKEADDKEEH